MRADRNRFIGLCGRGPLRGEDLASAAMLCPFENRTLAWYPVVWVSNDPGSLAVHTLHRNSGCLCPPFDRTRRHGEVHLPARHLWAR